MSLREVSMFYVLREDQAHRSFIRAWLAASGVNHRRVYTRESSGRSGGISFVLAECRRFVEDARWREANKAKTRVIVALDADQGSVEERLNELACATEGADGKNDVEIVCALIPKRHIETWVHALAPARPSVNEDDSYKTKTIDEVRSAERALARMTSAPSAPPSLAHGYRQLQRLGSTD